MVRNNCLFAILLIIAYIYFGGAQPAYEVDALYSLYNSTNGTGWIWRDFGNTSEWNFNVENPQPCADKWQGVVCAAECSSTDSCSVLQLQLAAYNLTGQLPSDLYALSSLQQFEVKGNRLSGTIPSTISLFSALSLATFQGNLLENPIPYLGSNLLHCDLAYNRFEGTFPSVLSLSPQLTTLEIYLNKLSGTIPTWIGEFSHLQKLEMAYCSLTGTLPVQLGHLTALTKLDFERNSIEGTFPTSFSNLHNLKFLLLDRNNITGTFPSEILNLTNLEVLGMTFNPLTGTLPTGIGALVNLNELLMDFCDFSGPIPTSFGLLTSLGNVDMGSNAFTGSLPTELGNIGANALVWAMDFNFIEGTIPSELTNGMSGLVMFSMQHNLLTGPISTGVGNWSIMRLLVLTGNSISGTLPTELGKLNVLTGLFLNNALLTGTIPEDLCDINALHLLALKSNYFGGTIPSCLGVSTKEFYSLDLQSNSMVGTIPSTFFELRNLQTLILKDNKFAGNLVDIPRLPSSLRTVDISSNGFTGPLPTYVFQNASKLSEFIASANCFISSISPSICNATSLNTLVLTGISSGSSCATSILDIGGLKAYKADYVDGEIPSCLFLMPALKSLYLSGNGINSPLHHIDSQSVLTNLSLSYNRLHGTIPLSVQEKAEYMRDLDLSNNRLSGTVELLSLNSNSQPMNMVDLNNNRLSGGIPYVNTTLVDTGIVSINILAGNMFTCPLFARSILEGDPNNGIYVCGSNNLSFVSISFGVLYVISLVCFYVLLRSVVYHDSLPGRKFIKRLWNWGKGYFWMDPTVCSSNLDIHRISVFFSRYRAYIIGITFVSLIVFMPMYIILKYVNGAEYRQYSHQYGWLLGLSFLNGLTPGLWVGILWCVGLLVLLATFYGNDFGLSLSGTIRSSSVYRRTTFTQELYRRRGEILCILVDIVVVCLVNAGYVIALLYAGDGARLSATALTVLFKVCWNSYVCVPVSRYFGISTQLTIVVLLFNNILVPIAATMTVDEQCFQSLLIPPDRITTSYEYTNCALFVNDICKLPLVQFTTVSVEPQFIYSFHCSSSLLTNYVPVYVAMYAFLGFILPAIRIGALLYFLECVNYSDGSDSQDGLEENVDDRYSLNLVVVNKQKLKLLHYIKTNSHAYFFASMCFFYDMCFPIESASDLLFKTNPSLEKRETERRTAYLRGGKDMTRESAEDSLYYLEPDSNIKPIYQIRECCYDWVVAFVVLLTYGLAYPPLACFICVYIVMSTLIIQVCIHAHSVQVEQLSGFRKHHGIDRLWHRVLAREMEGADEILYDSTYIGVIISICFVGFFVADTTISSITSIAISGIIAFGLVARFVYWHKTNEKPVPSGQSSQGMEMNRLTLPAKSSQLGVLQEENADSVMDVDESSSIEETHDGVNVTTNPILLSQSRLESLPESQSEASAKAECGENKEFS